MLHLETIEKTTLELLSELQKEDSLKTSYLVGGTSLALRLGYRKSIDLDLFLREEFDAEQLSLELQKKFGFQETFRRGCTLKGDIDDVKIDIIRYDYEMLQEPDEIDGIRMLSIPDIIAMKLSAIADNGTRVKDFVDISFLSKDYSLQEMVSFYEQKYPNANKIGVLTGLTYYEDIDHSDPVNLIGYSYNWNDISTRLEQMTSHFYEKFYTAPCTQVSQVKKW